MEKMVDLKNKRNEKNEEIKVNEPKLSIREEKKFDEETISAISNKEEKKKEKLIYAVTGVGIIGMGVGIGITAYASSFLYPIVSMPQNVFTVLQELPKVIATQQSALSLLNTGLSIFIFSGLTTAALDYLISNAESIFHPGLKKKNKQ
ncbi:MAG: hypothetical protein ACP5FX_00305 [Candidatus Micrarchaeia archaeon]